MRWRTKQKPEHHAERWVLHFAWYPVWIEDQYVWLERYWQMQFYTRHGHEWINSQHRKVTTNEDAR